MTNEEKLKQAGLNESYWGKIILEAEKRGSFSLEENNESADFKYCACGKAGIPEYARRTGSMAPLDATLYGWGLEFVDAICVDKFTKATNVLIKIEKRVRRLYYNENGELKDE